MKKLLIIITLLTVNNLSAQVSPEKLSYELRFGFIKGGEAVYQTKTIRNNNRDEIHALLHGYTTGFANKLYAVDDRFESYIDNRNLLPVKSFKRLKEQNYRFNEEVTFNHEEEVAISKKSGRHIVKKGICDVSSLMTHLRFSGKLDHLQPNQIIEIPFWDTDEWYMLKLKYAGTEKIETCMGKKDCIRLKPMEIAGRFFSKKDPMNIWVTNDNNKLPVLMELNFTIGSVKCKLVNVS